MRKILIILGLFLTLGLSGQIFPGVAASQRSISISPTGILPLKGLLAYYKMNEASGNIADAVGANNGVAGGNPIYNGAGIKVGITFDGTGDAFVIGKIAGLRPTKITVAGWFYTSTSSYDCIASDFDNISLGWHITTETTNLRVAVYDAAGHSAIKTSATTITTGNWIHVVITSNGTELIMYLNGVKEGVGVAFPYNIVYSNAAGILGFCIGKRDAAQLFVGGIDEIAMYNRAMAQAGVDSLYNNGNGVTYP